MTLHPEPLIGQRIEEDRAHLLNQVRQSAVYPTARWHNF